MIKLNVKERGYMIEIPGITPFRSPAKIDISNVKLPLVVKTLNNLGVQNYEITALENGKTKIYTKKDFEKPKKEKTEDLSKINKRFNKIEEILYSLVKKQSNTSPSEEQITNKLEALEELSKRILEKESVREVVYTSSSDIKEGPIVEELDEDTFIPDIDLSEMKLRGSSSEKIGKTEDAEETADILSRLTKT
jgi:uncharacterized protein YfkK (UPF0435 family)